MERQPNPPRASEAVTPPVPQNTGRRGDGPVVSKPNSVSGSSLTDDFPRRLNVCCAPEPHPLQARPIQRIA
jgi:hypothetical protein